MLHYKSNFSRIIIKIFNSIQILLKKIQLHMLPEKPFLNPQDQFYRDEHEESYKYFKKYFYNSVFKKKYELQSYAINRAISNFEHKSIANSLFLEFGVFSGTSINHFSDIIKDQNIYGFDSFEGINEDWYGTSKTKGMFTMNGKLPKVNSNVKLIKGLVQETLINFLNEKENSKIIFVHMDLDVYASSKFVLKNIKKKLTSGSIILFDELYNFPGWGVGEYKALSEEFEDNEYKFIAFCSNGSSVAIEII